MENKSSKPDQMPARSKAQLTQSKCEKVNLFVGGCSELVVLFGCTGLYLVSLAVWTKYGLFLNNKIYISDLVDSFIDVIVTNHGN